MSWWVQSSLGAFGHTWSDMDGWEVSCYPLIGVVVRGPLAAATLFFVSFRVHDRTQGSGCLLPLAGVAWYRVPGLRCGASFGASRCLTMRPWFPSVEVHCNLTHSAH